MKESKYDWTVGPIKDRKTPYVQHLFASGGLAVLNDKATARQLVLSGDVGTDKAKYSAQVAEYDQYDDDQLTALLNMEPEAEQSGSDDDGDDDGEGVDYDYLDERVSSALKANKKKLTENVIAELEEALEIAPKDPKLLAWLKSLQ